MSHILSMIEVFNILFSGTMYKLKYFMMAKVVRRYMGVKIYTNFLTFFLYSRKNKQTWE